MGTHALTACHLSPEPSIRRRPYLGHAERYELAEATAALQDLAIGAADEGAAVSSLAELEVLQAGLEAGIKVMNDGPYLVTGARSLTDWLGQPMSLRPQWMATLPTAKPASASSRAARRAGRCCFPSIRDHARRKVLWCSVASSPSER